MVARVMRRMRFLRDWPGSGRDEPPVAEKPARVAAAQPCVTAAGRLVQWQLWIRRPEASAGLLWRYGRGSRVRRRCRCRTDAALERVRGDRGLGAEIGVLVRRIDRRLPLDRVVAQERGTHRVVRPDALCQRREAG